MFTIRRATENDIPEIKQLFRETILNINTKDYTLQQAECWAGRGENDNIWAERIKTQYFVVAEKGNQIAGFAALMQDSYLNSLFVHKDYQRCGIASLLLRHIESYSLSNDISVVTADVSITARPFFERKGYNIIKEQTVDIGVKMTNYKMVKTLVGND